MFLEECKYIVKEKKTSKCISDDIEFFFDESDKEICNKEWFSV